MHKNVFYSTLNNWQSWASSVSLFAVPSYLCAHWRPYPPARRLSVLFCYTLQRKPHEPSAAGKRFHGRGGGTGGLTASWNHLFLTLYALHSEQTHCFLGTWVFSFQSPWGLCGVKGYVPESSPQEDGAFCSQLRQSTLTAFPALQCCCCCLHCGSFAIVFMSFYSCFTLFSVFTHFFRVMVESSLCDQTAIFNRKCSSAFRVHLKTLIENQSF